ncbi:MAG: hypothetical protein ACRDQ4_04660 [Pseudonocardiaceae bacterium]
MIGQSLGRPVRVEIGGLPGDGRDDASPHWPQLEKITSTWRGGYGYVSAHLPDEEQLPLCRLRHLGSDTDWGFTLHQASSKDHNDAPLPDGNPSGTPEEALDCALCPYLTDPTTRIKPPKD